MHKLSFVFCLIWSVQLNADVVLRLGEIQALPKTSGALLVGSKRIIEVKAGRIIAKKVGETTLSSSGYFSKVSVLTAADWALWKKLKALSWQKQIHLKNGQVHFKGSLPFDTFINIEQIVQQTQGHMIFEAKVAWDEKTLFEKQFRQKFSAYEQSSLALIQQPYLQIEISKPMTKNQILKKLSGIEFPIINTVQKDTSQPLVQTLVVMAEINKTESHQFGLEWPSTTTVDLLPKWTGPDSLLVNINAMESQGHGKVLAKPILVCKSGSEAQFLAGGEFPIRIISRRTKDVIWKQHGILLKIKPTVGLQDRINLVITSEISLLDKANAVEGIPALKTNRVQSEINVTSGQVLALSGLLREDLGTDRSGVFGLASLPILGPLFRSENFLSSRSELVVFIVPKIKEDHPNLEPPQQLEDLRSPFDFE